ncbi:MAG: ADP-ribosylglycohydrolase family protein [Candidatus Jordarchaeum sp.]|uniref:ADP-ribosylglycohydrolase family protein n=1 Tax=Candidatus Jordarchaeum sp. TaxID=2823881 RepID=UPI0040496CE0
MHDVLSRIHGCLVGLTIGDALGAVTEDMTPFQIRSTYGVVKDPLSTEITDDTILNFLIAEALIENKANVTHEIITKAVLKSADCPRLGPSTKSSILRLQKNPTTVSTTGNTNGAAMRTFPIGLCTPYEPEVILEKTVTSSLVTHGTSSAIAAATAVACAASAAVEGFSVNEIIEAAFEGAEMGEHFGTKSGKSVAFRIKLADELVSSQKELWEIQKILYREIGVSALSWESIPTALAIFSACKGDIKKALIITANAGGDTDTLGCIVGGLCGAKNGINSIPKRWKRFVARIEPKIPTGNVQKVAQDLTSLRTKLYSEMKSFY